MAAFLLCGITTQQQFAPTVTDFRPTYDRSLAERLPKLLRAMPKAELHIQGSSNQRSVESNMWF